MSIWNIGKDDISEHTQALKDTAASKEIENAGLRNQLLKRDTELNELKSTLNETLHKLSYEADRALRLESDVAHVSEDLTNHKITSQNTEQALAAANAKLRASELNERELQSHIEVLSHRQDEAKNQTSKLEKEKKVLEVRIRELDGEIRQLSAVTSGNSKKAERARSSSVSAANFKATAMEQELSDVRTSLAAKEGDLRTAHEKLGRAQTELVQTQNEHIAMERRMKKQISELQESLEEKEDELENMRAQQGDGGREREEELMKRVEEDEAKIMALEMLVSENHKLMSIKDALGKVEKQLKVESQRAEESERRCAELAKQKEDGMVDLKQARRSIRDKDALIRALNVKEKELLTQIASLQADSDRVPAPSVDSDTTAHIATLLGAIERLRSERDNLRRDLNFLESENKFAVQALEAKIASVAPTVHENGQEQRIKSLTLAATASTIMVGHLQTQLEDVSADFASQLADTIRVSHADIKAAHRETKQALDQAKAQLSDLAKSLEEAESERDSLRLQVTNLESDLAMAQEELTEAEGRYSTLQTQQFSSMSSTEVARTLRQQIEELEMRVLRRTEQIGIHQHDIKRLETNLRLEEERLGEMTSELETLGEQKEAMVWDCADAREARDEAIQKCEGLEMELEALEGRLETSERERQQEVVTLIEVIAETTVRSRNILRRSVENNDSAAQALQATLALAVAHVELKSKSASLEVSNQAKADLQTKVEVLQEDLAKKVTEMKRLEQQLADLRQRSDANAISESQTIDQLRGEHSEQMATLQKMLDSTVYELQEAKAHHSDAEVHHQKVIEEASRSKTELESRLAAALERTQTVGQLKGELAKAHTDHAEEVNKLQEQIRRDDEQLQEVIRSRAELETLHQTTATELTRTKEDYEAQLSKVTLLSSDTHRQLEDDLAAVKGQLEHSVDELKGLQIRLQEEIDARDRERQKHTLELQAKAEECRSAESLEAELHQEIAATRTQLDQTQTALQALEAEKSALQIETTNLGAEIQRTVSLNRFMESEIKACQSRNASLQETLDNMRGELSRSEKSGKEAEINLSLQSVRNDQIISGLRRELTTLKSYPKLDSVVAELEEKNRDMDELLKSKCAEIEDHDDRILEMLKEKKKLTTKVESLTRKVQSLQNKLAGTKGPVPGPSVEKVVSPPILSNSVATVPRLNSIPPTSTHDPRTPVTRPTKRVVSGPASLSRPKTPERRQAQPAVFKAKTPEKRVTSTSFTAEPPAEANMLTLSSISSVGKKRARPEEFDDICVPVQALYADQERENATPRLRKPLHSVQGHTGFTPVRRTKPRASNGAPSPGRRISMGITDVTNSPRSMTGQSAKAGKRSWLGKIRGVSSNSQTNSNRTPSSRPGVFERVPGS